MLAVHAVNVRIGICEFGGMRRDGWVYEVILRHCVMGRFFFEDSNFFMFYLIL